MKTTARILALLLLCIVVIGIFSGCTPQMGAIPTPPQWPTPTFTVPLSVDWETTKVVNNGVDISTHGTVYTLMEALHYSLQWHCSNIAIAKYVGMTDLYHTGSVEHHFELIEPIKGYFGERTFTVRALQDKEYATRIYWSAGYEEIPYTAGENCIVFLDRYEDAFEAPEYYFASIYIPLDENNKLKGVYILRGKVDIGCTTVDELKTYMQQYTTLNVLGPSYTTSQKLKDTVHIAKNVYRVTQVEVEKLGDGLALYSATVAEVLKGEVPERGTIRFVWHPDAVESGKEYIISMGSVMDARSIVSPAHGIIPIEDVRRVKLVYGILGKKWW